MTEISAKAQEEIQKAVEFYPGGWRSGVCAFQILNRTTGAYQGGRKNIGECHAPLSYPRDAISTAVVVNAHKAAWQKTHPEFLLWVDQESPFSHGVLNKDNKDELFNHASVIDIEQVGTTGALWICKAERHFTEDTFKLKYWDDLRAQGLDGLQAFIGADILDGVGNPSWSTHVSLFGYTTPANLRSIYDEIRKARYLDGGPARRGKYLQHGIEKNWGGLKHKIKKVPDGWGGYIEKKEPTDVKEYAAKLKEIFEGDPKNVK